MTDTPSRIVGLVCVLLGVWVATYWLYQPAPRVTLGVPPAPPPVPRAAPDPTPVEPKPADPASPTQTPRTRRVQKLIEPQCREYTVQKGDTSFERVAARKEVYGDERRSDAVARANPWADPTKLKPGITVLRIPVDPTNIQGKLVWVEEPIAEEAPSPPVPTPAPEPPPQPPAKTYTTQRNDTLSDISKKFYGRAGLWKLIADANKDVISNPDRLPNGVVIKIPPAPAGHPGSPPD